MELSVFMVLKGILVVFLSFLMYMFTIGILNKFTDEKAALIGALFITIGFTYVIFMWFLGLGLLSVIVIAILIAIFGKFFVETLIKKAIEGV